MQLQKAGLDSVSAKKAIDISKRLAKLGFSTDEFLEMHREWESRSTIAAKRLFSSLSILLAIAYLIGLDYDQLTLWGISGSPANAPLHFTAIFLILIILFGLAFSWNRSIDSTIRHARFVSLNESVRQGECLVDKLHTFIPSSRMPNVLIEFEHPPNSGIHKSFSFLKHAGEPYLAIQYFREHIKDQNVRRLIYETLELALIFGAAAIGFYGLLHFWSN